jgi:hypothetical protein
MAAVVFAETLESFHAGVAVTLWTSLHVALFSNPGRGTGYLGADIFRGFTPPVQANSGTVPLLRHDCFLPNSLFTGRRSVRRYTV